MTETETLFNGRWLRLRRRGRWEFAERTNPGGGVIIIAVTPENRILFVEQWREAVRSKTIEMPAGLVGDLGDLSETASAAIPNLNHETDFISPLPPDRRWCAHPFALHPCRLHACTTKSARQLPTWQGCRRC